MTYWERWDKEGMAWKRIFNSIDPILVAFTEEHNMKISRWLWDAPDREIIWEDTLNRSIHLYVMGDPGSYGLFFEGAAWKDIWENHYGKRLWRQEGLTTLPITHEYTVEPNEFRPALEKAYESVRSWQETNLKDTVELAR